jgi:hypothetical protein
MESPCLPRTKIIKSTTKEQKAQMLMLEPKMNVKYGRIMDAKMGLLERIHGDTELVNCNLAEVRLRNANNKKYVINNSVIVRVGESDASDDDAEPTRITSSKNTVMVST